MLPRTLPTWPALWLALAGTPGCVVRFYQPMSTLVQPVVVDPQAVNFPDLALDVRCVPGDALDLTAASRLCRNVRLLFEQQGAQVTTGTTPRGATSDADLEDDAGPPRPIRLTLELRARVVHRATDPLSWIVCLGTFTVVPAVSEYTFAQDIVIRDETGFLLADESLRGRLVTRSGAGVWLGNHLLDLTRPRDARVTGNAASVDLSTDLYGQLSQLVFNAQLQAQVLLPRAAEGQP